MLYAAAKARARIASSPLARLGNICARGVFFITKEHLLFEPRPGCFQGKHNNGPRKGIAQGDRLKATFSIGVTAMFPNLKWIPRKHKPCMEDLYNMMQTRTIFLGKSVQSDLVNISWPLQQCATWLASHPPPASSNALPVRAWDCLGLLSCGAAGNVAKAKDFFNSPPLHCLGAPSSLSW